VTGDGIHIGSSVSLTALRETLLRIVAEKNGRPYDLHAVGVTAEPNHQSIYPVLAMLQQLRWFSSTQVGITSPFA